MARRGMLLLACAVFCCSVSFGQEAPAPQPTSPGGTIRVSVDGLTCSAAPQGTFTATSFRFAVNDALATGGGGAGAGKVVFSDLTILKQSDTCSLPLLLLGASGKSIKRIVLTELDRSNKPILTFNLENAIITTSELKETGASEQLLVTYAAVTVTDAAGNTTGRITP